MKVYGNKKKVIGIIAARISSCEEVLEGPRLYVIAKLNSQWVVAVQGRSGLS